MTFFKVFEKISIEYPRFDPSTGSEIDLTSPYSEQFIMLISVFSSDPQDYLNS
jgi:hypothetical protein